jgi:hypothetical protein
MEWEKWCSRREFLKHASVGVAANIPHVIPSPALGKAAAVVPSERITMVRNGRIGRLHTILVGVPGSVFVPGQPPEAVPGGFDYDMWLGPAPWAPHSHERCRPFTARPDATWTQQYSSWYHISDYCIGFIGNWGIHHVDIAQWGHGSENTGPVEIEGSGTFPGDGIADCALSWQVENTFADGVRMIHMDNTSSANHPEQIPGFSQGILFRGTRGWVFVNRSTIDTHPKTLLTSAIGPNDINLFRSKKSSEGFSRCHQGAQTDRFTGRCRRPLEHDMPAGRHRHQTGPQTAMGPG